MHFRHRQTDRQMDTDIVAKARDVYITSCAKMTNAVVTVSCIGTANKQTNKQTNGHLCNQPIKKDLSSV